ncbi:hypothetical protein ACJJTC_009645 [Scirpophaga incertulas]
MEFYMLVFAIIFVNLSCILSELSLRVVFVIESQEPELPQQVGKALKMVEDKRPGLRVQDAIVILDRENDYESYRKLCAALSKGVSVILDLSWSPWEQLDQLSSDTGLPVVRTQLGVQQLVRALDQYLESRNATDAAYLMESEADVDQVLYELMGRSNIRVWVHAGLTRDSARALKAMRPEPSFYVVVGGNSFVTDTYRRAVKEKMVRRDYRWNLVLTDYGDDFNSSQLVLPTMVLSTDSDECCKLLGLKDECTCSTDFKRKQYIISTLVVYLADVYSKLEGPLIANVDCENIGFEMNGTKDQLIRQLTEDSELINDTLFYWDEERSSLQLRSRFTLSTYNAAEGLKTVASWSADENFKLMSGAVPWTLYKLDPETGEPMHTEEGQPLYEGYCVDLIAKLAEAMDFDYEIVTPKTGTFGRKLPNGTWDGIVGDLMLGETDMAVAALTMTAEREEVIDFVAPYFEQTGILIAIRKPIRKTSLFKFMTVLRTEVWLSIVAALILTGFMIWLLDKYSPYSARNNPEAYPYPCREFTLKESFWFALTSFTPQGGGEAPKALSGRTLVAAYWLFVVLMLATFTANLAAFLTVERMQTPVSSLEQLARQSRINYTVVESSTIHQYFINMKFAEDTLYRVWKEITLNATSDQAQYRVWDYPIREQYGHILLAINASGPVPDAKTGFEQVNEHTDADFAFIHDSAEIKYEVTRNCNLTEVGEVFAEQPYAIAVQQGSRLQEHLSRALLDLQKERFLEQLAGKYWNESARQLCPDADESEGITLESLGGVFIATLFGLGLAMVTLAWEVFYYKRKERKKVQTLDAKVEAFTDSKKPPKTDGVRRRKKDKLNKIIKTGNTEDKSGKNKPKEGKLEKIKTVTLGDTFRPAAEKMNVSYISVYPKSEYRP